MTYTSKLKPACLVAAILTLASPSIATAQSSAQTSAPLADLYACQVISDSRAQLSCFISETAKLQAAETSGDVIAVEKETFAEIKNAEVEAEVEKAEVKRAELDKAEKAAAAKQAEEKDFGLIRDQSIKKRTLAIASTEEYGPRDYMRFTLENGEVWQQTQAGRFALKRNKPNTLTIKRASFGSFLARANDKGQSVRVRRVK